MIAVPPAAAAGAVQITVSTTNPGVTTLDQHRRAVAQFRRATGNQVDTPLLYITLTAGTSPVTFQGFPGFALTLPASAGTGPFYLAELEGVTNGSGTWTTISGPASASGSTMTLQPSLPSLSIAPNESIYFVLYTGGVVPSSAPQSSASPQAPVSSSPSASPTATATASPHSTTSPGATPTPVPSSSSSPAPVASPTGSPTLAPTVAPTSTASPTPFPTASPSPTPTPGSGTASTPQTLSISGLPSGTSGTSINFATGRFTLGVLNSSGAQITGSFANTVTVTSSDTTGVVQLSVNGGTAARSVSVTSGSDLIALIYNGDTIGSVAISASSTTASTASATFTPAIEPIAYSGPTASGMPEIDLYAPSGQGTGSTFGFSVSQPGYTGAYTLSVPSGCSSFATVVSNGGGSYTVNAIASPVAGSCTLTVGGYGSSLVSVKLTYMSFGVVLQ